MKKIIIAGITHEDALATMIAKGLDQKDCILLSTQQANITRHWIVDLKGLHGLKKDSVLGSMANLVIRDYPQLFSEE